MQAKYHSLSLRLTTSSEQFMLIRRFIQSNLVKSTYHLIKPIQTTPFFNQNKINFFSSSTFKMSAPHPVSSTSSPSDPAASMSPEVIAPVSATEGERKPSKEKKPKKAGGDTLVAGMNALELDPKPEFLSSRIEMFERIKAIEDARIAGK